jgi:hypothetical protein
MDKEALAQRLEGLGLSRERLESTLKNPEVALPLMAAATGGLAGGVLSGRSPRKPGETRAQKRRRILRDALFSAGAAGGATALGQYGYNQLNTAIPVNVENPASEALKGVGSVGAGVGAGWGVGHLHRRGRESDARVILERLGETLDSKTTGMDRLRSLLRMDTSPKVQTLRQDRDLLMRLGLHPHGNEFVGSWGLEGDRLRDLAGKARKQIQEQVIGGKGGRVAGLKSVADKTLRHGARFARRHPALATAGATAALAEPAWNYALKPLGKAMTPPVFTFE